MIHNLKLGEITIEVIKKEIKNLHLNVLPPNGAVRISAPKRMDIKNIRLFAISKLSWIKTQKQKFTAQLRESPRQYTERESHYLWGKRYLLKLHDSKKVSTLTITSKHITLEIKKTNNLKFKQQIFTKWYKDELQKAAEPLVSKWQKKLKVKVKKLQIRKMKTKWGSCTPQKGTVRLNIELAKKPKQCLEYIIVHEMIHLIEHTHNKRFVALMDRYMPQWRHVRRHLNELEIG